MSAPDRIKTWVAGEVLTSSDLNTEFNVPVNALTDGTADITVGTIATGTLTASGTVTMNGNSLIGNASSDTCNVAATTTFTGPVSFTGAVTGSVGGDLVSNLGLTLSGGVLTVTDAAGNALSSSNIGQVVMNSVTGGIMKTLSITAGGVFKDDANASSYFTNFEAGVTAGANWANDVPFFLYVVNKADTAVDGTDGHSAFFLARTPSYYQTPGNANSIGDADAIPVTDAQASIVLAGSYTQANYTTLPCQLVGAIRMRYATATHDWTIQTLGNTDGFGNGQLEKTFNTNWTFPLAQMGAVSGKYTLSVAGTQPAFSSASYTYMIDRMSHVTCYVGLSGASAGVGGGDTNWIKLAIPYTNPYSFDMGVGVGEGNNIGGSAGNSMIVAIFASASYVRFSVPTNDVGSSGYLVAGNFTGANDVIRTQFTFVAF